MKDDFEQRLSGAPLREIPAEWRARILRRASASVAPPPPTWWEVLSAWLWPSPRAWAAVGAVWMLIAILCFSGPRGPELYTVTPKGMTPVLFDARQYIAYVKEWHRLLRDEPGPREPEYEPILDRQRL